MTFITIPTTCPVCGKPVKIEQKSNTKVLMCTNKVCRAKIEGKLQHFIDSHGLDIESMSTAVIRDLIDLGWLTKMSDIFHLKDYSAQWMKKKGFGEKSVENILSAIDSRREITISELLSAAGIPKIGVTVSKKIEEKYPDWDSFKKAAMDNDLIHIDGIGDELAYNLRHYDYSWIDKLIEDKDIVIVIKDEPFVEKTESLKGQSIVITGKLKIFKKRADLEQVIKNNGGTIGSSITGKTTILINNDNTSTSKKNLDAQAKGVPIMTEQEFIEKFQICIS
jgi:DNA ligase (NAD+)